MGSTDGTVILDAMASETARETLRVLVETPAPPSAIARRIDTSLQNVLYHLENLRDAGVIDVAGTTYSEKGREMDVYALAADPLIMVAGDEEASLEDVGEQLLDPDGSSA